jgi:RNase P/RNase MRP subunit p29
VEGVGRRGNRSEERPEDLDSELLGREVEVVLQSGGVLRGRVAAATRYWLKLELGGRCVYVNKSFTVFVRPA